MTESEKSLIGSILTDPECIDIIRQYVPDGSYFKNILFGKVFDVAVNLYVSQKKIDIAIINDRAGLKGDMLGQLMRAVDETPTTAHAEEYAKNVRDHHTRRALADIKKINPLDIKRYPNVLDVITEIEKKASEALQTVSIAEEKTIRQLTEEICDKYIKEKNLGRNPNIISTGFYDLDNLIDGLEKGESVILAARPSMGKTALGLCICRNVAKKGHKTLIFSLEMCKERLVNRLLCMDGRINATRFKRRQLTEQEIEKLNLSAEAISRLPLVIKDDVRTTTEIRSIVAREKVKGGVGLVMIDFLTLLGDPQPRGVNMSVHVGNMAKAIQQMGHAYNIPIITLAQLSRAVESRNNKRPVLSDLRESGNIEESADKVLFIYRENYYSDSEEEKRLPTKAEIGAAKTRDGATGSCSLLWTPEYTRFDNIAREDEQDDEDSAPWEY